jgi:gliding motility-associated-like protein
MNKDLNINLQELLRNHSEQPPSGCWDKISSHLDAVQATSAGSSAANTSPFSQFVGSIVGKIAVTAIVATSIAVAAYFVLSDKEEVVQIAQTQEVTTIEQAKNKKKQIEQPTIVIENKTEKIVVSEKTARENNLYFIDTTAKIIEKNSNAPSPTQNIAGNPSNLISAENAASSQPQATEQQAQNQPVETKKTSVVEPTKETVEVVEDKDEPEAPKPPKLFIPNVFTPDENGRNYRFVIEGLEQVENTELYIATKDGKVVYQKRNYDNSWNGGGVPSGTYLYIFRFTYKGNQFMRSNAITIRR